jgi:hypothetical protein
LRSRSASVVIEGASFDLSVSVRWREALRPVKKVAVDGRVHGALT